MRALQEEIDRRAQDEVGIDPDPYCADPKCAVLTTHRKHLPEGRKDDTAKPRWDLLPMDAVAPIVDVLTYGAKKYAPDNWRRVPDSRARYYAAALRHLTAWWLGEEIDPESGLRHLAHVGCCVLFLLARPSPEKTDADAKK